MQSNFHTGFYLARRMSTKHESSMAMPAFMHSYSSGMSRTDSETYSLYKLQGKPRLLQAGCRWTCCIWVDSALKLPENKPGHSISYTNFLAIGGYKPDFHL